MRLSVTFSNVIDSGRISPSGGIKPRCEGVKSCEDTVNVHNIFLLLTMNMFHTFLQCFCIVHLKQVYVFAGFSLGRVTTGLSIKSVISTLEKLSKKYLLAEISTVIEHWWNLTQTHNLVSIDCLISMFLNVSRCHGIRTIAPEENCLPPPHPRSGLGLGFGLGLVLEIGF